VAQIERGGHRGRGECVPYPRYGESVAGVLDQIREIVPALKEQPNRSALQEMLPPGAARNALDCALWDLDAKASGRRAWDLAGVDMPPRLTCAFTLGLSDPETMHRSAARHASLPLLKIKVGSEGVLDRVRAVARGAPRADLIVDANESWTMESLTALIPALVDAGVILIEQPLPAGRDQGLEEIEHVVPVAADESCHTAADLPCVSARYDVVNIKLDKSGGLTGALELMAAAKQIGLGVMVGCMVGTSLAMAPAMVIGAGATYVDLDGPLLLARDRYRGLEYDAGSVGVPGPGLWG
jgi:L-alanine-DL-glutamate epimerase-like enolase superfamily enzyme